MYPRPRFEGFEVQMYFLASKIISFFVFRLILSPLSLSVAFCYGAHGMQEWGKRLCVASILLLLLSPEISVRRREVSLNSAAERLYAVLELIFATRSHRLFRWQRERFVPRAIGNLEFAVQLRQRLGSRVTVLNVKVARAIQRKMPSTPRRLRRLNLASDGGSSRGLITCPALSGCFAMPDFP